MAEFRPDVNTVITAVNERMHRMDRVTKLFLIAIICNDHILLEDVPGTGKTMFATTVAGILDLKFKRVQATPDLLPSDLTGINIYDQKDQQFRFTPGPIFTNILLVDEINRTSPKTQSSLLEAMAENQVTIDNQTYDLEQPFFVIATQNPVEHLGTYPLPQAQLDRFLLKTSIGYPDAETEMQIMLADESDVAKSTSTDKLTGETLATWQREYGKVTIDNEIVTKLLHIIDRTRTGGLLNLGISPRASQKFVRSLKASAYIHGRNFVSKDDIMSLYSEVFAHRVYAHTPGAEIKILEELFAEANF